MRQSQMEEQELAVRVAGAKDKQGNYIFADSVRVPCAVSTHRGTLTILEHWVNINFRWVWEPCPSWTPSTDLAVWLAIPYEVRFERRKDSEWCAVRMTATGADHSGDGTTRFAALLVGISAFTARTT